MTTFLLPLCERIVNVNSYTHSNEAWMFGIEIKIFQDVFFVVLCSSHIYSKTTDCSKI